MAGHVVVCGGTGFLGRAVCQAAAANGALVTSLSLQGLYPYTGIDRDQLRLRWNYADYVNWRRCDLTKDDEDNTRNPDLLSELEGAEVFIHALGTLKDDRKRPHRSMHMLNVDTVKHSMALARRVGARNFLLVSAAGAPPWSDSNFIQSKREAESLALSLSHFSGVDTEKSEADLNVKVLRRGLLYGREYFPMLPVGWALQMFNAPFAPLKRANPYWDAMHVDKAGYACYRLGSMAHGPQVDNLMSPQATREFLSDLGVSS